MQREQRLAQDWPLTAEERTFVTEKAMRRRLGLALQLKFYQRTGQFTERVSDLPEEAVDDLAEQLAASMADLQDGGWRGRSSQRHRQAILTFLSVRRLPCCPHRPYGRCSNAGIGPTDRATATRGCLQ